MNAIDFQNVTKAFSSHVATNDVSLSIEEGAFAVVLGPSGCGKTTLLRIVAGFERPDSGRVLLNGVDVTHLAPGKRQIGMVFQNYALFPHLNVTENLLFGVKLRKLDARAQKSRLEHVAAMLGLETMLARKPSQLSGGQQQRVALGRAIMSGFSIILMDEPLSNLDAKLRQEMRREIRALAKSLSITVLYVTHDQYEALGMGDIVIVMRNGRVEQMASPATLYDTPANLFVAGFIGSPPMNILPLEESARGPRVKGTTLEFDMPGASAGRTVGIRPEHLSLDRSKFGFEAIVDGVEYLGADSVLSAHVGDYRVSARLAGKPFHERGSRVWLSFNPEFLCWFDTNNGNLLSQMTMPSNPSVFTAKGTATCTAAAF